MGDNIVNFYSGQPGLNRLSFQRQHADIINRYLKASSTRFVLFQNLKPLVQKNKPGSLAFLDYSAVEKLVQAPFSQPSEVDVADKARARLFESARLPLTLPPLVFLGLDDRHNPASRSASDPEAVEGVPIFALDASDPGIAEEITSNSDLGVEFADARATGGALSGWEAGVFAQARALVDWNSRNKFCAACGSRTYSLWAGWKRSCSSALVPPEEREEGKEPCFSLQGLHNFAYPRTDSVVIMGILDTAGEKMLLGRQKSWPQGMYSCLAGFIEPGESFEEAVRREVFEEAGVRVGPVRYSSSQPWPYPANIMVGCFGRALDSTEPIRLDLDNELEDAQWFSKADLAALVSTPKGSELSRADLKLLDKASSGSAGKAEGTEAEAERREVERRQRETADALAPSEGKVVVKDTKEKETQRKGLTRVPPATAIAGMLVRTWLDGGVDVVGMQVLQGRSSERTEGREGGAARM